MNKNVLERSLNSESSSTYDLSQATITNAL